DSAPLVAAGGHGRHLRGVRRQPIYPFRRARAQNQRRAAGRDHIGGRLQRPVRRADRGASGAALWVWADSDRRRAAHGGRGAAAAAGARTGCAVRRFSRRGATGRYGLVDLQHQRIDSAPSGRDESRIGPRELSRAPDVPRRAAGGSAVGGRGGRGNRTARRDVRGRERVPALDALAHMLAHAPLARATGAVGRTLASVYAPPAPLCLARLTAAAVTRTLLAGAHELVLPGRFRLAQPAARRPLVSRLGAGAVRSQSARQHTAARRERLFPGAVLAVWRGRAAVPQLGVRHANGQPGPAG